MAKSAFLFPGQGSQFVGMGQIAQECGPAKALFDKASSLLGYDLLEICLQGPKEKLDSTDISQPALFVSGLAAVEILRERNPAVVDDVSVAAGLSLGEYTALAFAGAMRFEDGLRVVQVRGESMQAAADATPSGMVSILGMEPDAVSSLCQQITTGRIWPANFLCPGNIAVSGDRAACEEITIAAEAAGATKVVPLQVAGAFHTAIMHPAVEPLRAVLESVEIQTPRIPVYSNVDATIHTDPATIRANLVRQACEPVQWEQCIRNMMSSHVDEFFEVGPGRVLAGILKRIHRRAAIHNHGV